MVYNIYSLYALILLSIYVSTTSGFFLSWGSPEPQKHQQLRPLPPPPQQYPTIAYYQRVMQQQQQYVDNNGVPVQIPAIPIQVPLQAQLAPNTVQNVQLVPCLCPVSQDIDYVENTPGMTVSQMKPQPIQNVQNP